MKGRIVCNGNIRFEVDFVRRSRAEILESRHVDPEVRRWRKVLLITAAWRHQEFDEGHVKEAFLEAGVPSRHEGGYERNIQNLGVYHEFDRFKEREPALSQAHHEKQDVIIRTKEFYRRKNADFVRILRDQTTQLKEAFPGTTLAQALAWDGEGGRRDLALLGERELLFHFWCHELQDTMRSLVANDARMLEVCRDIERYFRERSRIDEDPTYLGQRDELRRRILSANSVFIFGGSVAVLLSRLQFYRLRDAFQEALWRGTSFYAVSAGSMALSEKVIVFDDFWGDGTERPRKEFEFFDEGLGLVTGVTLFPHCMDRIQTDDPDNLTYLAHRFSHGPCVGLNEESFMLVEPPSGAAAGRGRDRFVSVGERDGVYVFDRSGTKICRRINEEIGLK